MLINRLCQTVRIGGPFSRFGLPKIESHLPELETLKKSQLIFLPLSK
jgi:hypothetical protein